jgi:hypothetical protein
LQSKCVITRTVKVAAGVFAPGHLGELTRFADFELVDRVVARCGGAGSRVRVLPGRVTVYFVLALALFADCSYRAVWGKLTASLVGLAPGSPVASSLARARARLGPGPVKALFEELSGPVGDPGGPGVCRRGWRTVALDGTTVRLPDRAQVTARYAKRSGVKRTAGYPLLRLVCLVETGTRAVIAAVFGPESSSEKTYALELAGRLDASMLVLADAFFDAFPVLAMFHARAGAFLVRSSAARTPKIERRLPDGSYLATVRGKRPRGGGPIPHLRVRVLEAVITVHLADGTVRTEPWRLITSLLDPEHDPAADLIALYHERWQAETCYAQLKTTVLSGRVLRSCSPEMIEQELWAVLALYQLLVRALLAAAATGQIDSDRLSFTIALETARNQTVLAADLNPSHGRASTITRALLAQPHPAHPRRRLRARTVKSLSKYWSNHGKQPAKSQNYTLDITIGIFEGRLPARPRT